MGVSGYRCTRNGLAALNVMYMLIGVLLIGIAGYAKALTLVSSASIIGGIIACGVFLLLISLMGLIGAMKQHQICLFFYMVILFLLFIVQFSVAVTCLALSAENQGKLIEAAWTNSAPNTQKDWMRTTGCCGFQGKDLHCADMPCCQNPSSHNASCCQASAPSTSSVVTTLLPVKEGCPCADCYAMAYQYSNYAFKTAGGIGLVFSFTEIIGVVMAFRYRNLRDPRANPDEYL